MNDTHLDIVMVPVPISLLPQVYALLARSMNVMAVREQSSSLTSLDWRETVADPGNPRQFTAGELGLLKRHLDPASGAMTLLDLCASRPGDFIRFEDVVAKSGLESTQVRGQISGLTKLLKKLFQSPQWPLTYTWGAHGIQQAAYEMSVETARMWTAI